MHSAIVAQQGVINAACAISDVEVRAIAYLY